MFVYMTYFAHVVWLLKSKYNFAWPPEVVHIYFYLPQYTPGVFLLT